MGDICYSTQEWRALSRLPQCTTVRRRYAPVNSIEVAYETFGDPVRPAILLVMGLGTQMIAWPDEMCEALAGAGRPLRFTDAA